MTVFQANGDKRKEQNVILSRSSPRPNNLDITVSFGNIPIILIIPFINAFVLLGLMSKPREKKKSAKKKRETTTTEIIIRMILIITTIMIMIIIIMIIILYSY